MSILLGISGVAGSGKDTLADYLVKDFNFLKMSFADPMKRIARDVFDFSEEQLWGPSPERSKPDRRYLRPIGITYPAHVSGACWIPLTKGEHALINEVDFNKVVKAGPWCVVEKESGKRTRYAKATVDGKEIKLHQFIFGDTGIDHINGDGLDNRRVNLRKTNDSLNHANMFPRLGGSSPFKGVSFDLSRKRWSAKITVNRKTINLGRFDDEVDAALAYDKAAKEHFGEHSRTNSNCFLTPRYALQTLGTEFGRNCYQNVWVEYALRQAQVALNRPTKFGYNKTYGLTTVVSAIGLSPTPIGGVSIPDCRFKNELDLVKKAGGKIIRIKRPGSGLSGSAAQHASEAEQLLIPDDAFDFIVDNDGTLDDLRRKALDLGEELDILSGPPEPKQLGFDWNERS